MQDFATLSLGTLASNALVLVAGPVMTRGGKMLSLRGSVTIHTITVGNGPFEAFLVSNSISAAQLLAYLQADGPVSPNDTANVELATRGRNIRPLGLLLPVGSGQSAGLYTRNVSMAGLAFSEGADEGGGWSWAILNHGPILTTGATAKFLHQVFVQFAKG